MNHAEDDLREMYDYPRPAAVIAEAAKEKCMRFDVTSLEHGEIAHAKNNIMVLWGDATQLLDCLLECGPCGITRKQPTLSLVNRHLSALSPSYPAVKLFIRHLLICRHKQKPNELGQARRTTGSEINRRRNLASTTPKFGDLSFMDHINN